LKRNEALGQVDLFGDMFEFTEEHSQVPDRPEFTKRDKLAFEREMLGLYVSDHPLAGLELQLAKHATVTINDLTTSDTTMDGDIVVLAGLVTEVQRRIAKKSSWKISAARWTLCCLVAPIKSLVPCSKQT
ncbi:MAG: hypothetical protein RR905_05235, partial [Aurantimicrobium sp.]